MDGTIDPTEDYVERISRQLVRTWPSISAARLSATEVRGLLSRTLTEKFGSFSSGDIDVIAFGSLARQEWTAGSDIDWTLLIDGQATPDHRTLARDVETCIRETVFNGKSLQLPGAEGIFGNMAFSHDIIHHIGGQADTNRNTTQRVLLLLEACAIRHVGFKGDLGPYERVVNSILFRYLHDDTNFVATGAFESRIPRFLLNDIVRYWRTMCVDFAYKEWEQAGGKWALRNIKLRMSRKLLFVSALLTVFSCYLNPSLGLDANSRTEYVPMMQSHLMNFVRSTPMNIVAWALLKLGVVEQAGSLLDCYDRFIDRMNDETLRIHLRDLPPTTVYEDKAFLEFREVCHDFQNALNAVFFQVETELRDFTLQYGVF